MSVPDRIREFEAANSLVATTKEDTSKALEDLKSIDDLIASAENHSRALREERRKREVHLRVLRKREQDAQSNLEKVEERFQVIVVDCGADVGAPTSMSNASDSNASNNIANRGDAINSSNSGTHVRNAGESNGTTRNNDVGTVSSDEDSISSNCGTDERSPSFSNQASNSGASSYTTGGGNVGTVSANHTPFLWKEIVVEGCGETCVNGSYTPCESNRFGSHIYSKRGIHRGHEMEFALSRVQVGGSKWMWTILTSEDVWYSSHSESRFKNELPDENEWFAICGDDPCPKLTGHEMSQSNNS